MTTQTLRPTPAQTGDLTFTYAEFEGQPVRVVRHVRKPGRVHDIDVQDAGLPAGWAPAPFGPFRNRAMRHFNGEDRAPRHFR